MFVHTCYREKCPNCKTESCDCQKALYSDGEYMWLICPFCEYKKFYAAITTDNNDINLSEAERN